MTRITAHQTICAPAPIAFAALTDVEHQGAIDEDVVGVRFLSEQHSGAGTRFVQTRRGPGGKEQEYELEVTEYVPHERARFVTDSHGTVWDTVYTFEVVSEGTAVTIEMQARAHALLPRLLNPLMRGFFRRGIEKHLTRVKAYCERRAVTSATTAATLEPPADVRAP